METKRTMIAEIRLPGQEYENYYRITDFSIQKTKNGDDYALFTINDLTGKLLIKQWNVSDQICQNQNLIAANGLARVKFQTQLYQDQIQGIASEIEGVDSSVITDLNLLVPLAPESFEFYWNELYTMATRIKDPVLSGLTVQLLVDYKGGMGIPAGKSMHDACLNGLLHHMYRMARSADQLRSIYPEANWDLVIAGAIAHDIGKIREFDIDGLGLVKDYTRSGKMLGHSILGIILLRSSCTRFFKTYPDQSAEFQAHLNELVDLLEHMLESHHGKPEFGAAIPPKFMEAKILSFLDDLDAKIVQFSNAETDLEPGSFSERKIFGLDTQVYRPSFK